MEPDLTADVELEMLFTLCDEEPENVENQSDYISARIITALTFS